MACFQRYVRRCACSLLGVATVLATLATTGSNAAIADSGATSDRTARLEAIRAIPWRQLTPQYQQVAQDVVNDASLYRRLPTRVIDCDPEVFTFLLQHPEVVIDVWRVMGISQVSLDRQPNGNYRGSDGAGTAGNLRYIYADWQPNAANTAVVYADGAYEGKPFIHPLRAKSIILLRSGAVRETNGRQYITVRIDTFMKIEQVGVELVAKTVQPWISKTADRNFIETLTFVSTFSRTAERNPEGMKRLATRLEAVDQPTRDELVAICFRTADRYAQRDGATRTSMNGIIRDDAALLAQSEWIRPFEETANEH